MPEDNHQISIGLENIFDTLSFTWSESYNFLGDYTFYSLSFSDSLGYVNNEDGTSIFSNMMLGDNQVDFLYVDLFRKMDTLAIENVSLEWQVNIQDTTNFINQISSDNGPFILGIERELINIDAPIRITKTIADISIVVIFTFFRIPDLLA